MKKRMYYYMMCGAGNTFFGIILYYIGFHYIFDKQVFDLGFYAMKPHIAAYFFSILISVPSGFLLSKYIVWAESELSGKKQLQRHITLTLIFIVVNYFLLKFFVEQLFWWPLPSQIITTGIIILLNYLAQKYYSFK